MRNTAKGLLDGKRHLRWLLQSTRSFRKELFSISILSLLIPILTISGAVASKNVIDAAVARNSAGFTRYLVLFVVLQLMILLLGNLLPARSSRTVEQISNALQYRFLQSFYKLEWHAVSNCHSGDILTRLTSDVKNIALFHTTLVPQLLAIVAEFVLAFALLLWYDPMLALFGFFLTPFVAFLSLIFGRSIKGIQRKLQENEGEYRSCINESIQHLVVIKCFDSHCTMLDRILRFQSRRMQLVDELNKRILKAGLTSGLGMKAGFLLAFIWGTGRIFSGHISFGVFVAFLQLMGHIQNPLTSAAQILPRLMATFSSLDRYRQFDGTAADTPVAVGTPVHGPIGIRIRNLSFGYHADAPVLKDVSLDIRPGETVAVTGSSGIGKTTFMRLLLALVHPQTGSIRLTHCNPETGIETTMPLARNCFSYVPQGNTLFSGSIAENLRIADEEASTDELWEVLRIACAAEFVSALPEGILTAIGENGLGLSEGQAQRIGIARALLSNRPVLLLDEATSALDSDTEERILQNIRTRMAHKTCIAVTHRHRMKAYADAVVLFQNQCIIPEEGCMTS